jgi:ribosomal protein S18 acetylase RimI-like enzyme
MNPLIVRPLEPEDQLDVLALARSLARWFRPLDQIALAIDLRHHEGLVAEQDAALLGFLTYHLPTPTLVELSWLGVRTDRQGTGVGAALLAALERRAAARGADRIQVSTLDSSTPEPAFEETRRFYQRHGFHPLTRDADYFAPGRHRVLLEKNLR